VQKAKTSKKYIKTEHISWANSRQKGGLCLNHLSAKWNF